MLSTVNQILGFYRRLNCSRPCSAPSYFRKSKKLTHGSHASSFILEGSSKLLGLERLAGVTLIASRPYGKDSWGNKEDGV